MRTTYTFSTFASTYGQDNYNCGTYDNAVNATCSTTTGAAGGSSGGGGTLTNTGIAVAAIVTVAAVILLVAVVVRIWKRPTHLKLDK